jgi:hypothetical protein
MGEKERVRLERDECELVEHAVGDDQRHHGGRRCGGGRPQRAHRPRQGHTAKLGYWREGCAALEMRKAMEMERPG